VASKALESSVEMNEALAELEEAEKEAEMSHGREALQRRAKALSQVMKTVRHAHLGEEEGEGVDPGSEDEEVLEAEALQLLQDHEVDESLKRLASPTKAWRRLRNLSMMGQKASPRVVGMVESSYADSMATDPNIQAAVQALVALELEEAALAREKAGAHAAKWLKRLGEEAVAAKGMNQKHRRAYARILGAIREHHAANGAPNPFASMIPTVEMKEGGEAEEEEKSEDEMTLANALDELGLGDDETRALFGHEKVGGPVIESLSMLDLYRHTPEVTHTLSLEHRRRVLEGFRGTV